MPHGQATDLLRRPGKKKNLRRNSFSALYSRPFIWDIFKQQTLWKCQHAWETTPLVTAETGT